MRTLDDIIPPSRRPVQEAALSSPPAEPRSRRGFPLGTLLVVLLIIALSAGALFYFSSAEVKTTPLSRTATLSNTSLTATSGGTNDSTELSYEVITVQKVASQSVTSAGTKAVSAFAEGTITIYNTQSSTQKLITNTRFQTASGLVFRIHAPIVVPGAKGGTPGSVTATVYADKAGSGYNIGASSFVLPGLLSTPQFTQVTAKSNAPMTGGSSGNEPTVASETETATRSALMDSLAKDLTVALQGQVPQGYILLGGAFDTSYAPLPTAAGASSGMAEIKEQGTMRGVIFSSGVLAKAVAKGALGASYKGEKVTLGETTALVLKPTVVFPASNDLPFAFTLSGTVSLISVVDSARVAAAVAGKSRDEAEAILKQYPEIAQAVLILRPFWRSSFPEDPSKIDVEVLHAPGN